MVQEMSIFGRILNIRTESSNGSTSIQDIQRKTNSLMFGSNGQMEILIVKFGRSADIT